MPRVQIIDRQVGTSALPDAKLTQSQTPDSLGAGLAEAKARKDESLSATGDAIFGTGQHLGELQTKHKTEAVDQANEVALLDASNKLDAGVNQMLYDPENGALTVKGKDAMGLPEATASKFGELADNVAAGLTNDKQKNAFLRLRAQHEQNLDMTIRRHVFEQTQVYDKDELNSFLTNKKSNAVANALDPRRVFEELNAGVDAIKANASRQGLGPEATQTAVAALQTDVHTGVISSLLDQKNDAAAKVYFEETKDQINGGAAAKIEKAIAEGALRGQAQKTADALLAEGGTDAEMSDKVKKIEDPELRDAVQERVEHAQAVRDKQQRDVDEKSLNDAYAAIDQTHTVDSIPPATWTALGVHQPALRAYALQLAKGEPIATDPVKYYGLMSQAADDPEAFTKVNLLESRGVLDNGDFKQLTDLQYSIRKGDREAAQRVVGPFEANNQMVDDALMNHGLDPKAKDNTPQGKANAQLRWMLRDSVSTLEASSGKKLSSGEVQQQLDKILMTSKTTPGSWWGLVPFNGVSLSDTRQTGIIDVPIAEQQRIRARNKVLRPNAPPLSDADVIQLYLAGNK